MHIFIARIPPTLAELMKLSKAARTEADDSESAAAETSAIDISARCRMKTRAAFLLFTAR